MRLDEDKITEENRCFPYEVVNDFWESSPAENALEINWLGEDFIIFIINDAGELQSKFEIRDIEKNDKVRGKKSKWFGGKNSNVLKFVLPICKKG